MFLLDDLHVAEFGIDNLQIRKGFLDFMFMSFYTSTSMIAVHCTISLYAYVWQLFAMEHLLSDCSVGVVH